MSAKAVNTGAKGVGWTDLAMTLPLVLVYHLGVVFLPVRNGADLVTEALANLAAHSLPLYALMVCVAGLVLGAVAVSFDKTRALRPSRVAMVLAEAALYAVLMRIAATRAVGELGLARRPMVTSLGPLPGLIMSFGAGFYEEVAFRVVGFGLGFRALAWIWPLRGAPRAITWICWSLLVAAAFSAWHYFGAEHFTAASFVFRLVCGLAFTVIYTLRGFAPAVFTHALYDVWVLVF